MPKFKAVFKKRLLKLAEHLETGKLGHKKFNFGVFNADKHSWSVEKPYSCGYAGCALGECPVLFPRKWQFAADGSPVLSTTDRDNENTLPTDEAAEFFGITRKECALLFVPYEGIAQWNRHVLGEHATKKQVAASIRRFVAWKEKETSTTTAA